MNLKKRFLIPTGLLVIISIGLSTLLCYVMAGKALTETVKGQIFQTSKLADRQISIYLKDRMNDIKNWGQLDIFATAMSYIPGGNTSQQAASRLLEGLKKESGYFEYVCLADSTGQIISASGKRLLKGPPIADCDYFKKALEGKWTVSKVTRSRLTGSPVLIVAGPVKQSEAVAGVIVGGLDLKVFSDELIKGLKVGDDGMTCLFQADGKLVAHPDSSLIMNFNVLDLGLQKDMIRPEEGISEYSSPEGNRFATFRINRDLNWTIMVTASKKEIQAPLIKLGYVNLAVGLGMIICAAFCILIISGKIVGPAAIITEALSNASNEIEAASGVISSVGQELASGASDQAARIEKASSYLNKLTLLSAGNAQKASQVEKLMKEVNQVVAQSNDAVYKLSLAIRDIEEGGRRTSSIMAIINEFSLQTGLLALNASVEAARSGEAGIAFSVVAEEVKNLAMKSSGAADSTNEILEQSANKIEQGVELTMETEAAFREVAECSNRVSELIMAIASVSNEQALGMETVQKTIMDIDKVVRDNVAHAEESASASEEMHALASEMKASVENLKMLL